MRTLLIAAALALTAVTAAAQLSSEDCLTCHDTVDAKKFGASIHAPLDCTGCHSDVREVPHEAKPKKVDCASCHPDSVEAWNHSLHAKALAAGTARGATCTDCHGGHHELQPLQR